MLCNGMKTIALWMYQQNSWQFIALYKTHAYRVTVYGTFLTFCKCVYTLLTNVSVIDSYRKESTDYAIKEIL